MPLLKSILHTFSNGKEATILVWKISETLETLAENLFLKSSSIERLAGMKSEIHQRGFLSIRHLLALKNLTDANLFYDEVGKPHLTNGVHISISHSFEFSTIVLSNANIGIDIEHIRDKIALIAPKFCLSELSYLNKNSINFNKKLTSIWAAKEAVFKIKNQKGISFKNHMDVSKFDENGMMVILNYNCKTEIFEMQNIKIENFMLVYGIKIST